MYNIYIKSYTYTICIHLYIYIVPPKMVTYFQHIQAGSLILWLFSLKNHQDVDLRKVFGFYGDIVSLEHIDEAFRVEFVPIDTQNHHFNGLVLLGKS